MNTKKEADGCHEKMTRKKEKRTETIEKLKKDPGISLTLMAKKTGISQSLMSDVLRDLRRSEDPEIKKLCAKREAYLWGGSQLIKILKEQPGANYRLTARKLTSKMQNAKTRTKDPEELLKGLIGYCKKYKDEELREILIKHKKAGGWMP